MSEPGKDRPRRRKMWKVARRLRYGKQPAGIEGPDDPPNPRGRRRRDGGQEPEGGAGVREPRRPKPSPPAMGAELDEPRDQFVDATSSPQP